MQLGYFVLIWCPLNCSHSNQHDVTIREEKNLSLAIQLFDILD